MEQLQAQAVDPTAIDWAITRLTPPTERDLRLAHRVGLDPNILLERFAEKYQAATAADAATINRIVGDDESCGPVYRALWDFLNRYAVEHHHEWWVAPLQHVARIMNPRATSRDLDGIERWIYSNGRVGHVLNPKWTPETTSIVRSAGPARTREHRPGTPRRRTASSSRTSSSDPGDGESEPAPALGLIRHERFGLVSPRLEAVLDEIGGC